MSYQTSIHFDPTALLIIKNEVDNSIQLIESAVSTLVEDQALPFGIDDALTQFEQCAQVLVLINMDNIAKLAQYSANLMRKMIAAPTHIQLKDVLALSDGTSLLKRYIEFICLKEVQIPQFLLPTLNRLELALNYPLTPEGSKIAAALETTQPHLIFPPAPHLEKTNFIHRLYKISLFQLLKQPQKLDVQALKIVGAYLASMAHNMPSTQYWHSVHMALNGLQQCLLTEPRLRTLIHLERHIAVFLQSPHTFTVSTEDFANILSICISQESEAAQHLRQQLHLSDEHLSDPQLHVFSRQLYGPDFETIHTISELIRIEISQVQLEIEQNYQDMSPEKIQYVRKKLIELSNIFFVLNLSDAAQNLRLQAQSFTPHQLKNPSFAEQVMQCIQSAMNAIGILERQHTSNRLQLGVNNPNISLDLLDEAHQVLLDETQAIINLSSQNLMQYLHMHDVNLIHNIPAQFREIGGALLFVHAEQGQHALNNAAEFIEQCLSQQQIIHAEAIKNILESLASADMLINNVRNKQPVLYTMFNIALRSSETLKNVA